MKNRYARYSFWLLAALGMLSVSLGVAAAAPNQPLVEHEIRYRAPEAGAVAIVWGIDGWQALPAADWPDGTELITTNQQVMHTPMHNNNGVFSVVVRAPAGSQIDYVFQITKTRSGVGAEVWDVNGVPERDFATIAREGGVTENAQTVSLGARVFTSPQDEYMQVIVLLAVGLLTMIASVVALRMTNRSTFFDF